MEDEKEGGKKKTDEGADTVESRDGTGSDLPDCDGSITPQQKIYIKANLSAEYANLRAIHSDLKSTIERETEGLHKMLTKILKILEDVAK
jgi:hypothetical protein